jgi:acyl dehydratase
MSLDVAVFSRAFDELWVGETFVTRARTITETDVVSFAALTGDWHPQHADAEWASRGPFGQRIAHGMLVLSYAVGLVPLDPERVVALRRVRDAVFKRPVRLGDTMRVKGRLERLDAVDDGVGIAGWLWTIVNQEDRVVARVEIDVLWRREQPPARARANGSTGGVGVAL